MATTRLRLCKLYFCNDLQFGKCLFCTFLYFGGPANHREQQPLQRGQRDRRIDRQTTLWIHKSNWSSMHTNLKIRRICFLTANLVFVTKSKTMKSGCLQSDPVTNVKNNIRINLNAEAESWQLLGPYS